MYSSSDDLRSWDGKEVECMVNADGLQHTYYGQLCLIGSNNSVMIDTDEIIVEYIVSIKADNNVGVPN